MICNTFIKCCFLLVMYSFLATACGNKKKESNSVSVADSVNEAPVVMDQEVDIPEENTLDSALVSIFKQIAGTWNALDGDQELTVLITKDSFFYAEHSESHIYKLRNDSLYIHYPDYVLSGKPLLLKDTLAIISEDQTSKFLRKRN